MFGTIYWKIEDGGSAHDPLFVARMSLQTKEFTGSGMSHYVVCHCWKFTLKSPQIWEFRWSEIISYCIRVLQKYNQMLRTVIRLYLLESLFLLTCVGCWLASVNFELVACCHSTMIVLLFFSWHQEGCEVEMRSECPGFCRSWRNYTNQGKVTTLKCSEIPTRTFSVSQRSRTFYLFFHTK